MKMKELSVMLENGDIEECIVCGAYSAYAWDDVSPELSDENDIYSRPTAQQRNLIAHIGAASGEEWECGHCGAHHVERTSPMLAECYTHVPAEAYESEDA